MSALVGVQRRFMELGRIRLGDKGAKGQPQRLTQFRLTSASRPLLEAASHIYGGTVNTWDGAPDEGYFELYTTSDTLDVIVPPAFSQRDGTPSAPYSQYFELWSGGGCTRRCDGETELITGKPCACDPDNRACKITTRASLMLPRVPGLGVWRLESHGWNAATEMTGTLELLRMAAEGNQFIRAYLRIEQRTQKVVGEPTRRFIVPVLDLPDTTIGELALATGAPLAINAPTPPPARPALPASPPPVEARLPVAAASVAAFGEPPVLPVGPDTADVPVASESQRKLLFARAKQHGVTDPRLKEIVLEVAGVDSSKLIPKQLVDRILEAIDAEPEIVSPFQPPASVRAGGAA